MEGWLALVDNADFVGRTYGAAPPLEGVELHEVVLHRDGPIATLRFDLPTLPPELPRGWPTGPIVVGQLTWMLVGVSDVAIRGWSTTVRGDLTIVRTSPSTLRTTFEGSGCSLSFESGWVRVAKLSGYAREAGT